MADEGFCPCKLPKLKHEEDDLCYMGLNTEDYRELCDAVAVVCVDGHEHRLPVHSTELAKHSPVLLTACVVHKYSSSNVPLELRDPFQHGTLGGVELFLACCYQFHDRMRVLRDSLTDHPGGERGREAWRLAHALDAQQTDHLVAWLVCAEECKDQETMKRVIKAIVSEMIAGHMQMMNQLMQSQLRTDTKLKVMACACFQAVRVLGDAEKRAGCSNQACRNLLVQQSKVLQRLKASHKQMVAWGEGTTSCNAMWLIADPSKAPGGTVHSPTFTVGAHTWGIRVDLPGPHAAEGHWGVYVGVRDLQAGQVVRASVSLALRHATHDFMPVTNTGGSLEFKSGAGSWDWHYIAPVSTITHLQPGFLSGGKAMIEVAVELIGRQSG